MVGLHGATHAIRNGLRPDAGWAVARPVKPASTLFLVVDSAVMCHNVRMGILYKLTFANGKCYIGITTETLKRRVQRHVYCARIGRQYALSAAIRKYGEDGFLSEVLGTFDSWSELTKREIEAINQYDCMCPGGYNMTGGGEGTLGVKKSIEARRRIGAASSQRNAGRTLTEVHKQRVGDAFRGKPLSEATKEKMREAAKLRNSLSPRGPMSQEQKDKIRATLIGKKHPPERVAKRHERIVKKD